MPSRAVIITGIATWADEDEQPPTPGTPAHPIHIPGTPAHPIYIPVYPAHPIELPPEAVPPGSALEPSHPIYIPVYPAHPIAPGGSQPPKPGDPDYPGYNPPSGGNVPQPVKK